MTIQSNSYLYESLLQQNDVFLDAFLFLFFFYHPLLATEILFLHFKMISTALLKLNYPNGTS